MKFEVGSNKDNKTIWIRIIKDDGNGLQADINLESAKQLAYVVLPNLIAEIDNNINKN